MIACEVMFVEQRAGGSQGSSVWLVQLVLHRLCGKYRLHHALTRISSICAARVENVSRAGVDTRPKVEQKHF